MDLLKTTQHCRKAFACHTFVSFQPELMTRADPFTLYEGIADTIVQWLLRL